MNIVILKLNVYYSLPFLFAISVVVYSAIPEACTLLEKICLPPASVFSGSESDSYRRRKICS
jgi:hypothetical protein